VDNGGLDNLHQENILVDFLRASENFLLSKKIKIAFESEYSPDNLTNFIDKFNPDLFGINYDIGNSAALGFDPKEELRKYGKRIINVHIKDRKLGGTTVPLGRGNADFVNVFSGLAKICYGGNYILQTARADGDAHAEALSTYREQVKKWMPNYAS
jgi:hexulose-6-phosphate isomerase